jgi:hypothetical protein
LKSAYNFEHKKGVPMKKKTLTYRFHDPNPPEVAAEFLAKLFVAVNADKVCKAVLGAANDNARHENERSYYDEQPGQPS